MDKKDIIFLATAFMWPKITQLGYVTGKEKTLHDEFKELYSHLSEMYKTDCQSQ